MTANFEHGARSPSNNTFTAALILCGKHWEDAETIKQETTRKLKIPTAKVF